MPLNTIPPDAVTIIPDVADTGEPGVMIDLTKLSKHTSIILVLPDYATGEKGEAMVFHPGRLTIVLRDALRRMIGS